ncbi:MAG: DNA polymerase III subunit epsilon [Pseudomonadota bacterium]
MRQVVLDTETTGLEPEAGHRVIEIGCVELVNRRLTGSTFHRYLNPDRAIDAAASEVHGITGEFLADKPRFTDIKGDLLDYLLDAELIIHNAPFDLGFLDSELRHAGDTGGPLGERCIVLDTLVLARSMHPGQRNSLDALCKRYGVDNSKRDLHGALLDARILADVYLTMTGGQGDLSLTGDEDRAPEAEVRMRTVQRPAGGLRVITPDADELAAHEARLDDIDKAFGRPCLWRAATAAANE